MNGPANSRESERLDYCNLRLSDDPYDLGALVERVLASACIGQLETSAKDFKDIKRLNLSGMAIPLLREICAGRIGLVRHGTVYIIAPEGMPDLVKLGWQRCAEIASFYDCAIPPCLIHFTQDLTACDLVVRDLPGIALVTLRVDDLTDLPRRLDHEIAHILLMSGNRFLDEGLAVLAETCSGRQKHVAYGTPLPIPLRELLVRGEHCSPVFDDIIQSSHRDHALYDQAGTFIAHLRDHLGLGGLKTLIEDVARVAPVMIPHLLEARLGVSLDAVERRLFGAAAGTPNQVISLDELAQIYRRARVTGEIEPVTAVITALEPHRSNAQAAELLARCLAWRVGRTIATGRDVDFKAEEGLIAKIAGSLPSTTANRALAETLSGTLQVAALVRARDPFGKAIHMRQARQHLEAAVSLSEAEHEASLALSSIFVLAPKGFGQDFRRARELLETVARSPDYRAEADMLLSKIKTYV